MYLEHFKLKRFPFTLTPNTEFFCSLPEYRAALNVLLFSLRQGEGFIKIIGDVGMGKTLLCRMLLENYKDEFVIAYIPNPDLTSAGLRCALAKELDIPKPYPANQHELLELIMQKLMELHGQNKQVVLLLDEAQALPFESLEALRLLTNLETRTSKLLQIVLFAQPELDKRLEQFSLRQLKQRITFSYYLKPLNRAEFDAYLHHRLAMSGYTHGDLFDKKTCNILYQKSKGIPRVINTLSHKAMLAAYGRGQTRVNHKAMQLAIKDTGDGTKLKFTEQIIIIIAAIIASISLGMILFRYI